MKKTAQSISLAIQSLNTKALFIAGVIMVVVLICSYIAQVMINSGLNHKASQAQQELVVISLENQNFEALISDNSTQDSDAMASNMGYEKIKTINYIKASDISVAQR